MSLAGNRKRRRSAERPAARRGAARIAGAWTAAAALIFAGLLFAQAPAGPVRPPAGAPPQRAEPQEPIRVKVELVTTPVTVTDAAGELVLDLQPSDFRVYDNNVEQRIEDFDLGGDPLSVVIVIERSARAEVFLPAVRRTGILFTQVVLGQTGEAALLTYDDRVEHLLDFTGDHEAIEKAIAGIRLGTRGARMHDALAQAVGMLRRKPDGRRRVVIMVGLPRDQGSETPLGAVLREAQLNSITIYTVALSPTAAALRAEPQRAGTPSPFPEGVQPAPGIPGQPQTPTTQQHARGQIDILNAIIFLVQTAGNAVGQNSLELASAGTGGRYVPTFRDRSIDRAIDEIGGELHAQYTITYRPTGVEPAGYHEIRVELRRPGLTARARPGYFLAPPQN